MTSQQHVPRFIPTLTEVVDPASLRAKADFDKTDQDALVERIQSELQTRMDQLVQQEFEQLLREVSGEYLQAMRLRLQLELRSMVRLAVTEYAQQNSASQGTDNEPRVFTDS